MVSDDAAAPHELFEFGMKTEPGLRRGVLDDTDALQRYRVAKTRAHGLGKSFLRGEAVGQVEDRPNGALVAGPLDRGQYATRETFPVLFHEARDPRRLHHVYADAVDHAGRPISAFISRTACAMPTNTDRAMIAWPMLSSRTCGNSAMGPTLR